MMDHDRFAQFGTRFGTQKSPGVATETGEVLVGAEVRRAVGGGQVQRSAMGRPPRGSIPFEECATIDPRIESHIRLSRPALGGYRGDPGTSAAGTRRPSTVRAPTFRVGVRFSVCAGAALSTRIEYIRLTTAVT